MNAHDSKSVLVIRPGALGDTLMLLPVLATLKGRAEVTVAARRPGLDFLQPHARTCVDIEGPGWHRLFQDEPDPADGLPVARPACALAFLSDPGGRVKANLERFFPGARVHVFPGYPASAEPVHAALYLARCAAGAGLPLDPEACMERAMRAPLLEAGGRKGPGRGLVLHPGSGGRPKNFSLEFWASVLDALSGAGSVPDMEKVTILLGPAEVSLRKRFEQRPFPGPVSLAVEPDAAGLCALLAGAGLYAGHDSGITHLAAMLGTPTLALFRETDPRIWGPLGPRVRVIQEREGGDDLVKHTVGAARALRFAFRAISPC